MNWKYNGAMQHIRIELQDENGKAMRTSPVNFADIMHIVFEDTNHKNKYPFLSAVDPYGDTTFNTLQVPLLVKEIENLSNPPRDTVSEVISFLNSIGTHQYIKFIGD
jgi:hypothetical protein